MLQRLALGEEQALDELFPQVYDALRQIARGQRRRRAPEATLGTTALIHEAYLRFAQSDEQVYAHREHFFAVAATAMRQILLDQAKRRVRLKRGGDVVHEELEPNLIGVDRQAELMLSLDQSLERLGQQEQRVRRVVDCRFFGGLSEQETATALGVDPRTVRRDWAKARAWLALELGGA